MATLLRRLYDDSLAQASYILACTRTKQALVVDPNRDVEQYLSAAARDNLKIAHVTETHIQADFVSGCRELAKRAEAQLYLSGAGSAGWQYRYAEAARARLVGDGDIIEIGDLRVTCLHTPGHTPEHLTFLVNDKSVTEAPIGAFTGDFVFVGDVGRPDLLERAAGETGTMGDLATQLFRSVQAFKSLPDHLQIWPGHGAGSPCGKSLGAVPQSTLGYERIVNWAFTATSESEFVREVLEGQPEPPRYFAQMKRVNRDGPPLRVTLHAPIALGAAELLAALDASASIVDTRAAEAYAAQHLAGTVSIPLVKSFPLWAGSVLPYDAPVCLIVDSGRADLAEAAIRQLYLIGLDDVWGYITWEMVAGVASSARPLGAMQQITPLELRTKMRSDAPQILDVRNGYEWDAGHVGGAKHIPLAQLIDRTHELDPSRPVVVHCQGGSRSAVAASVLEAHGFRDVANLTGGYKAWVEAGSER